MCRDGIDEDTAGRVRHHRGVRLNEGSAQQSFRPRRPRPSVSRVPQLLERYGELATGRALRRDRVDAPGPLNAGRETGCYIAAGAGKVYCATQE